MDKICYICGRPITSKAYCIGPNSYICYNKECYNAYYWDKLAALCAVDSHHEYVVCNNKVYKIGSPFDELLGSNGKEYTIQFKDGKVVKTNSLWPQGIIPEQYRKNFTSNARFI